MSDNEKFKNFFQSLNNCMTVEEVTTILGDFLQKPVFVEMQDYTNTQLAHFNKLSNRESVRDGNSLISPLIYGGELIGVIKTVNNADLNLINIISPVISLKIKNIMLTGELEKNLEFHNAMKNIAKIIETQYELNYIIPIIGEILDTFIVNHLVYIFLKQHGKNKLVYPKSCMDKKILETVEAINPKGNYIINRNKTVGYFPLVSEQNYIGCLVSKSTGEELTTNEIYYISQLSKQIATTITRANVYAEILKYATLDALTGFYNRRQLDERIKQETASAKRKNTSLCAIMTDIDFFKKVNDTYGHATGDLVLKTVAKIMRSHLREYDIAARYGGEEFAILLPSTNIKDAQIVAERLRSAVEKKVIDIEKVNTKNKTREISVTISVGVYNYNPEDKAEDLLMKADKALYKAKENGRNRVVTI